MNINNKKIIKIKNKAYTGATDSFTHPRVLLALTHRGILAQSD
jgi:hypothetical protein